MNRKVNGKENIEINLIACRNLVFNKRGILN